MLQHLYFINNLMIFVVLALWHEVLTSTEQGDADVAETFLLFTEDLRECPGTF